MKQGKIRRMLVGANTADGYKSFAEQNLCGLERVFMLMGAAGCGKSGIIARVAASMAARGLDVELWQSAAEAGTADGVVIPGLLAAVVDAGFMEHMHPQNPGVVEEVYDLGSCWEQDVLRGNRDEIKELAARVKENMQERSGLLTVLAQNCPPGYVADGVVLDEAGLDRIAAGLADEIFNARQAQVRRFFAAAYTADGWYSLAQELSAGCGRRILLGRQAGAVLALLVTKAAALGLKVEVFYDVLRPDVIQMVILPQLGVAVADAETPGLQPLYTDELYGRFADVDGDVDGDNADDVADVALKLAQLKLLLRKGGDMERRLAAKYTAAMDFERVDAVCGEILAKLWQMAAERGC